MRLDIVGYLSIDGQYSLLYQLHVQYRIGILYMDVHVLDKPRHPGLYGF